MVWQVGIALTGLLLSRSQPTAWPPTNDLLPCKLSKAGGEDASGACYLEALAKGASLERVRRSIRADLRHARNPAPLWLALGEATWLSHVDDSLASLNTAAFLFEKAKNWDRALQAHARRLALLARSKNQADATREIQALEKLFGQRLSPGARALGGSAIADYRLRRGQPMERHANMTIALSAKTLSSYRYEQAIYILTFRLQYSQIKQQFDRAQDDLELMTQIAHRSGRQHFIDHAERCAAYHGYNRAIVFPSHRNVQSALQLSKAGCEKHLAASKKGASLFCKIYITLSGNRPQNPSLLAAAVKNCFESQGPSDQKKDIVNQAECHRILSRVQAHHDPSASFNAAKRSLALTPELDSNTNARVSGWQRIAQVFWEQRPTQEARAISRAALLEIEFLREQRSERRLRLGSMARWARSYKWLSSRLMKASRDTPPALQEAFLIQERGRARALWENIQDQSQPGMSVERINHLRLELQKEVFAWMNQIPNDRSITRDTQYLSSLTEQLARGAYPNWNFASLKQIQALLKPTQAMLSYQVGVRKAHNGEDIGGTWAIIITKDKAIPLQLKADRLMLQHAAQTFTRAIRTQSEHAQRVLDKLKAWVLDPVKPHLPPSINNIILIPDGPLYSVPFFALDDRFTYTFSPSATIWANSRAEPKRPVEPRAVAIVDPTRSATPLNSTSPWRSSETARSIAKSVSEPLPSSRKEARAIQRLMAGSLTALVGPRASEKNLRTALKTNPDLVHISAHTIVGLKSYDPSSIALANQGVEDFGLLDTSEIRELNVQDALIVLGGCETGWGTAMAGEGMLSIARSFQEAGARAVLASLWPLRDDHTAVFFDHFYAQMGQGQSLAQSLARTQRKLKREGFPLESYAPFVILGDADIKFLPHRPLGSPATPWPWLLGGAVLIIIGVLLWASRRKSRSHTGLRSARTDEIQRT